MTKRFIRGEIRSPAPAGPRYRPSNKHCEPLTAEKPGTKCPRWSVGIAQKLLGESIQHGDKRYATHRGAAFVAQVTESETDVWHGYPEAWDNVPIPIKRRWQNENKMSGRDLKRWKTRKDVDGLWREDRDDDQ